MAVIRSAIELDRFVDFARGLGLPLEMTAKAWKPTRTSEANSYLFGVVHPAIAEAMGYTVDEVHEYALGRHFGWVDKPCPKKPSNLEGFESVPFRTTTRDENGKRSVLNKQQFSDFMNTVLRIAAQAGVFIPDPPPSSSTKPAGKHP